MSNTTQQASQLFDLSGKMIQETTTQYQKEQAVLLAKSYTEYAIMAVMSNDRNATGKDCIEDIDGKIGSGNAYKDGTGYLIETRIAFIGQSPIVSTCSGTRQIGTPTLDELNIIVDVYVKYKDINHPDLSGTITDTPWITYHRRTLQKI